MNNTKKGFTLVELLVVIAILAILSAVAVVGYTSFIKQAEDSRAQQELHQVVTFLESALLVDGEMVIGEKETPVEGDVKYVITKGDTTLEVKKYTWADEHTVKDESGNDVTVPAGYGVGVDGTLDEAIKLIPELSNLKGTLTVSGWDITYKTEKGTAKETFDLR